MRSERAIHALSDLFLAFNSGCGTDAAGEMIFLYPGYDEPWERALADHVDTELTEATAVFAAARGHAGKRTAPRPAPAWPRLDLAQEIWDLAHVQPTYAGWDDDEDHVPYKDRLPMFWQTPEYVRNIIHNLRDAAQAERFEAWAEESRDEYPNLAAMHGSRR